MEIDIGLNEFQGYIMNFGDFDSDKKCFILC